MKFKSLKRQIAMVLTMAMASVGVVTTAYAEPSTLPTEEVIKTESPGVINMNMDGTAEITVRGINDGTVTQQSIKDKQFRLYKIFEAENAVGGESINYTWNETYKGSIQAVVADRLTKDGQVTEARNVTEYMAIDYINSLNTNPVEGAQTPQEEESREGEGYRLFVEELRDQLEKDQVKPAVIQVDQPAPDNSFRITNIPLGFYIIDEITKPGTHSAASLCMTTTANNKADVTLKSDYTSVKKSIQENVEGWLVEGGYDYEIGQTIQYKLDSTVPDIRGYKKYVYNHHDLLDKAVTFNQDSVEIKIEGTVAEEPKTYTLSPEEFHVDMINSEKETFCIAIDDIKAIIDREFNNIDQKKPVGENKYGQKVVVTYTGTLNDKASADLGNPGYANTIWLEYSFNPDGNGTEETTETPKSTVKSYSYKLDLTKTNNHEKPLQGAEFKLYSDEGLQNEVFVKKLEDGYHVINRDNVGGTDKTGGTCPEAETMVSGEDGKVIINGLDSDEYWLVETKAPAGYRRILDPVHIQIKAVIEGTDVGNNIASLTATYDMKTFYNGKFINKNGESLQTDAESGTVNMTIVNEVGKKLPVTGTVGGILVFAVGVIAIGAAFVLNKKKKKA